MKPFLKYSKYLLFIALLYSPFFQHLGNLPIRMWDESRLATNAYEMSKSGDLIVTHFEKKPDLWNTKPPFMIWCQALCVKLFGVNEISVRLPSAIAAFLTCVLLLIVSLKYLKNFWFGFIAALVLATSWGYVHEHIARTGDYDSMLIFFTSCYSFFIFLYFENKKKKYLYLFFVCITLAVLTKSIAGMLFLPAILVYALWQKQVLVLLKTKETYIGIGIFLFFVAGYYLLREYQNPGYWKAVVENDLTGRYSGDIHKQPYWFYYDRLSLEFFSFLFLVPCGILIGLLSKEKRILNLTVFSSLIAVSFFFIISGGSCKLYWYLGPIYPFLAILAALALWFVFDILQNRIPLVNKILIANVLPFIFLFLVFRVPYQTIFNKMYLPEELPQDHSDYHICYYLRDWCQGKHNINNTFVAVEGYYANLIFYVDQLKDRGIHADIKYWADIQSGENIIAHQNNVKEYIQNNFDYEILDQDENVVRYLVKNKRENNQP